MLAFSQVSGSFIQIPSGYGCWIQFPNLICILLVIQSQNFFGFRRLRETLFFSTNVFSLTFLSFPTCSVCERATALADWKRKGSLWVWGGPELDPGWVTGSSVDAPYSHPTKRNCSCLAQQAPASCLLGHMFPSNPTGGWIFFFFYYCWLWNHWSWRAEYFI